MDWLSRQRHQLSISNAAVNVFLLGSYGPSKIITAWNDPNSSLTFADALLTLDCTVQRHDGVDAEVSRAIGMCLVDGRLRSRRRLV